MARKNGRYSNRSLYKETEVEVEIEFNDVMEYIEDYATSREIEEVLDLIMDEGSKSIKINSLDGDYVREEKAILLSRAAAKFTLAELEEKLGGNKFDFI